MSSFSNCLSQNDNIQYCQNFADMLKNCKQTNNILWFNYQYTRKFLMKELSINQLIVVSFIALNFFITFMLFSIAFFTRFWRSADYLHTSDWEAYFIYDRPLPIDWELFMFLVAGLPPYKAFWLWNWVVDPFVLYSVVWSCWFDWNW